MQEYSLGKSVVSIYYQVDEKIKKQNWLALYQVFNDIAKYLWEQNINIDDYFYG